MKKNDLNKNNKKREAQYTIGYCILCLFYKAGSFHYLFIRKKVQIIYFPYFGPSFL